MRGQESLNPRELQLNLDGFLEADSPQFVSDLWKLLISAQTSPGGIPAEFLEQKKAQLRQRRVNAPPPLVVFVVLARPHNAVFRRKSRG
jgi:hypothetical protein